MLSFSLLKVLWTVISILHLLDHALQVGGIHELPKVSLHPITRGLREDAVPKQAPEERHQELAARWKPSGWLPHRNTANDEENKAFLQVVDDQAHKKAWDWNNPYWCT